MISMKVALITDAAALAPISLASQAPTLIMPAVSSANATTDTAINPRTRASALGTNTFNLRSNNGNR